MSPDNETGKSNSKLLPGKEQMVSKYHSPRVAIVIPHYNYSQFIGDALISVQQQTYTNFKCVVVDDCSTDPHFEAASREVAKLADDRFKIVRNAGNLGQVPSVYRGIDETDAAFLAVLDPDDRYVPEFVDKMLAVHLNPLIICPIASCEQYLLKIGDGVVAARLVPDMASLADWETAVNYKRSYDQFGFHRYIPPFVSGWHWTSMSSMVFRTSAVRMIRPVRTLAYKVDADAYLAQGLHMMGGTLSLNESLVLRGIHDKNSYINDTIFSMFQRDFRIGRTNNAEVIKRDAVEAFSSNEGPDWFDKNDLRNVILSQFVGQELSDLCAAVPALNELIHE